MNKGELIEKVLADKAAKIESKAQAERAINAVLDAVKQGLKKEKKVGLVGFGTFTVKHRPRRRVINPQTKEKMWAKASKTVKFKPGKALKESL
jgi:nucleoid DNA-binding protein